MAVKIGEVRTFADVKPDKAQVVKIAEEWGEVYSAWENGLMRGEFITGARNYEDKLLDEIADVIQASCNLVSALGVDDFTPYIQACEQRNEARGRFGEVDL